MTPVEDGRPALTAISHEDLLSMREAAGEVLTCQHVLAKTGHNVITEISGGQPGSLEDWAHYPAGDVYDAEHHAQFYFHSHPEAERGGGEFGHFHLFLRREGIRPSSIPLAPEGDGLCHLVAVSVDRVGRPLKLFTTNRWVTNETWFKATDVIGMLDSFNVGHAQPSWPVNRWLTAMVRLYRPEIGWLLTGRDKVLASLRRGRTIEDVFEDRSVEIMSSLAVDIVERVDDLDTALRQQRRARIIPGEAR